MKIILSFCFVFVLILQVKAQDDDMFKALYIYNFTKNVDWPAEYKRGDLVIGIWGNTPLFSEMEKLANKKKSGSQNIVVRKVNNLEMLDKFHVLYLTPSNSKLLPQVLASTSSKPCLIITDQVGLLAKGSCINLLKVNGALKYEVNETNITKKGMKISRFLLELAIKN